jgi:3,4-dihydroxy 2-butanone 4-phosphate synthase/GTP cyclohydrolase II
VIHALQEPARSLDDVGSAVLERVQAVLRRRGVDPARPAITLAYAQSLDGCIASEVGASTEISNRYSRVLTHCLRAAHDALLVGVNTVIVDDPQLNVRLVPGENPVPVIADSGLRIPHDVQLLHQTGGHPIVAATRDACQAKGAALADLGAEVVRVGANPDGTVDLGALFEKLHARGIRSVMVEGGAKIITSVLVAELADQLVLTISPHFLGGVRSVEPLCGRGRGQRPELDDVFCERIGSDLVVQGELLRSDDAAR